MKIVCATSVTFGREAFSTLGEVVSVPERDIDAAVVRDADLLIVRSKVEVNARLLEGSNVSFVATATSGYDHFDVDYLETHRIAWFVATGCNANSVAEWVVAALLHLHRETDEPLEGRKIGIVGVGNIGTRVAALAPALGLTPLLNDPPRAIAEPGPHWISRERLLSESDIVTLHVPLTDTGPYATRKMVDCRFLSAMKPGAVFINSSRGEVVDEDSLLLALDQRWVGHAMLDVFATEPDVDPRVAGAAFLVTPHIAGYSYEGRVRGTELCYLAACQFLETQPRWSPPPTLSAPARRIDLDARGRSLLEALAEVVLQAYDISADDRALRRGLAGPAAARIGHFQSLRAAYPERREFSAYIARVRNASPELMERLEALGFRVERA